MLFKRRRSTALFKDQGHGGDKGATTWRGVVGIVSGSSITDCYAEKSICMTYTAIYCVRKESPYIPVKIVNSDSSYEPIISHQEELLYWFVNA